MTGGYDVVIVGAGSAGYAAALRSAQLGMSVALVEEDHLGGTCLHRGCIPTKALLHSAEVVETVRNSARFGVNATLDKIDTDTIHSYKSGVVDRLHKGLHGLISHRGVEFICGTASLVDPSTLRVGSVSLTGNAIVLATGASPKVPHGMSIGDHIITSDEALQLRNIPDHVIVLGGGVIGVEFASIWAAFGADVTILEAAPRLLPAEDEWISTQLGRALRKRGITCKTGAEVAGVTETETGAAVQLRTGEVLTTDLVLVAVGRAPRTDTINLGELGVAIDSRGFVDVDECFRTSVPGVYAAGDILAGPQLAHRGFQHGIAVAEIIAGLDSTRVDDAGVPRVTYSNPQIASVGLTEAQARSAHGEVDVVVYDLAGNGKSQISLSTGGVKLVRAKPSGEVVGIHMIGTGVAELIGEAQLIYGWGASAEDVAPHVHAHPTLGEALGESHLALAGKPLHSHG